MSATSNNIAARFADGFLPPDPYPSLALQNNDAGHFNLGEGNHL